MVASAKSAVQEFFLPLCSLLLGLRSVNAATCDVLIRGGRGVDSTGNPACFADVALKKGRIVEVGRLTGTAKTLIDANGLIVPPEFQQQRTHGIHSRTCATTRRRLIG